MSQGAGDPGIPSKASSDQWGIQSRRLLPKMSEYKLSSDLKG